MSRTGSVLVVDDDSAIRAVVGQALRRAGHDVTSVASLAEMRRAEQVIDLDLGHAGRHLAQVLHIGKNAFLERGRSAVGERRQLGGAPRLGPGRGLGIAAGGRAAAEHGAAAHHRQPGAHGGQRHAFIRIEHPFLHGCLPHHHM